MTFARVALALLAVATGSCGARTGVIEPETPPADARVDVSADAQPPGVCTLDDRIVQVGPSMAPAFAYSLQARGVDGANGWILASGHGWPPAEQGRITLMDRSLAVTAIQPAAGQRVFAGLAPDDRAVMATRETNSVADAQRWQVAPGSWTALGAEQPCPMCRAAWSAPVTDGRAWALAFETPAIGPTPAQTLLAFRDVASGRPSAPSVTVNGREAQLGATPRGPAVLAFRDGGVAVTQVSWAGTVLADRAQVVTGNIRGSYSFATLSDGTLGVAAMTLEGTDRSMRFARVDAALTPSPTRTISIIRGIPLSVRAAARGGSFAVTWGDQISPGAGTYVLVADEQGNMLVPPTLVSTRDRNQASYSIWSTIAPHPEGFLIVWGSWEPVTYYALYARVLRCPRRG